MGLLTMAMTGCRKSANEPASENSQTGGTIACETSFSEYLKIPETNSKDRAIWLKEKGKEVYPAILFKFTFEEHRLQSGTYQTRVAQYGQQIPLQMTWKEIKDIIKDYYYDKYVSFDAAEDGKLKMVLVDEFTSENRTCYSIPLFLSIADKLELEKNTNAVFEFSKVQKDKYKNENPYVIFKVSGESLVYEFEMNYSTKPELIEVQNPL